jgi:predicted GH43/DUF377 family glycosyl hydrolase
MYFESRGAADQPTVICSALSDDMLHWKLEDGIRLKSPGGVGGPRYLSLPDGRSRLYCFSTVYGPGGLQSGEQISQGVVSAITTDGLHFEFEPGYRIQSGQTMYDTAGITAAEAIAPEVTNGKWTMVYSAWQDVPPGTTVPIHPSSNVNAVQSGISEDFAAASIASDMAGFRSRIYVAYSNNGLEWERGECAIEGGGHDAEGIDAVHAEDMSVIKISKGVYRMYYAACDNKGNWRIASAITEVVENGQLFND